jgi:bacterioferritin-associated ferredoxin
MIICSCNAISDTSVKASINSDKCPRTPGAVYRCLGARPCCGRCFATVRTIIDETVGQVAVSAEAEAAATAAMALLSTNRHTHPAEGDCDKNCAACAAAAA